MFACLNIHVRLNVFDVYAYVCEFMHILILPNLK